MDPIRRFAAAATVALSIFAMSGNASAIPAFARKYGTSCQTCHTVYPKLTPFGEAFRRNGYRFPGTDSDYIKQEPVSMGSDEYKKMFPDSVWPGNVASSVPIAIGFNGAATLHPTSSSSAAKADNKTTFTTQGLVGEGHVWMGGSYDDSITYWGEYTFADGGSEIEHAMVRFNDIIGPKHAVNIAVGRFTPTLTSFGLHSSYASDVQLPVVPVTALFGGATDSFALNNDNNGAELAGVLMGHLNYAVGVNAGPQSAVRPTEDTYATVGYKIGGMRLDGEGATGPADPQKPWTDDSVTIDVFAYHSNSQFTNSAATPFDQNDVALAIGGAIRGMIGSLEVNAGGWQETHSHALNTGDKATLTQAYGEISYIVFPWMVPSVRVENTSIKPENIDAVSDMRISPAIAFLVRPNLKFVVVGQLESCKGAPDAGWGPAGGFATPDTATSTVNTEVEAISAVLATAF